MCNVAYESSCHQGHSKRLILPSGISEHLGKWQDGGWNDSTQTMQEEQVKILNKQEAAMKRERALAYAFSHQVCHPFLVVIRIRNCMIGSSHSIKNTDI